MAAEIRTGLWLNWSEGSTRGKTLTLTERDGGLLLSLIAAFVTVASAQLWSIISYVGHQMLVREGPRDGIYFQRQNILRNTATPYGAAWSFWVQYLSWRNRADRVKSRTLSWAFFAVFYAVVFTLVAVFSSQISGSAGQARLIESRNCGYWAPFANSSTPFAVTQKVSNDIQAAVAYARACYMDHPSSLDCGVLPRPSLNYTFTDSGLECPFNNQSICRPDLVIRLESQLIDSHVDLGINAPPKDRIQMRTSSVCSPLRTAGYQEWATGAANQTWGDEVVMQYNYGPNVDRETGKNITDYTHLYNTYSAYITSGYSVVAYEADARANASIWNPIPGLAFPTADLSLLMIELNSVTWMERTEDPVFNYTMEKTQDDGSTFWVSPYYLTPMACAEQVQYCHPVSGECAEWMGRAMNTGEVATALSLNVAQAAALERLQWASQWTTMSQSLSTRPTHGLRLQERLWKNMQLPGVPSTQWHTEVTSWFQESLSLLQHSVQEYASVKGIGPGSYILQTWEDPTLSEEAQAARLAQCDNQIVRNSQNTLSFSVLGLSIVFGIGSLIIILSFVIEWFVGLIQKYSPSMRYKRLVWISDGNLNVLQMLLESRGYGTWENQADAVPTSVKGEVFPADSLLVRHDARYSEVSNPQSDPLQTEYLYHNGQGKN